MRGTIIVGLDVTRGEPHVNINRIPGFVLSFVSRSVIGLIFQRQETAAKQARARSRGNQHAAHIDADPAFYEEFLAPRMSAHLARLASREG